MYLIVCLDDNNGMQFHNRRQSRDRVVLEKILDMTEGGKLWMSADSARLFAGREAPQIQVAEDGLSVAGAGEYLFWEDGPVGMYQDRIERVYVFRWNRVYPADLHFDFMLPRENLKYQEDFSGFSHDKITLEVYEK